MTGGDVPETILYNGTVHTVDARDSVAEAIAIAGERIAAVGSSRDLLAAAGPNARRIDLGGLTVTPGFIDAHPHMDDVGSVLIDTNWGEVRSIDDVLAVVAREVARLAPGEWLVLPPFATPPRGYAFPGALRERRWPSRADLDRVSPANPVYIEPHIIAPPGVGMANTAALKTAQLPEHDAAPAGVTIERDADGEPTGIFIDYNYPRRIPVRGWPGRAAGFPLVPDPPDTVHERALLAGMRAFNAAGLTAIYEGHGVQAKVLEAYRALHARGELSVRAYCPLAFPVPGYWDAALADRVIAAGAASAGGNFTGDDLLRLGGLGFSSDSAAGAGNSLMRAPYRGTQGQTWNGIQLASDDALRAAIVKTAAAGLRVQIQCSGGVMIDKILAIFEEIDREMPLAGKRYVIEHCQFPSAENMATCLRLGIVATSAVSFLWNYGSVYVTCFGDDVADQAVPYRSWFDAGVMLANSSDADPYEPCFGFWQMLARKDGFTGRVMGPDQRISRAQALRASTINGAYAAFWEDRIGSLEGGKFADLAILSQDIMTVPEDDIPATKIVATLLGGTPVHDTGLIDS